MKAQLNKKERRALGRAGKEGVYLYCIAPRNASHDLDIIGIGDSAVYTIIYNDLALIVSDAPMREYEPVEENVKAHKEVALSALQNTSVLPVAFGMVFKNKKILLATVRKVYPLLKSSLLAVRNKVELGVKVVLPKDEKILEAHSNWKGRGEFLKKLEADFLEKLGSIATSSKKGGLFSERLALNASFLVVKDNIEKFSEEVRHLEKKYSETKLQYSGPWPAYNFVDVRIMSKVSGGG